MAGYRDMDEKMVEGIAVFWAIISKSCDECPNLKKCETDDNNTFPENAPCMKKKQELLRRGMN